MKDEKMNVVKVKFTNKPDLILSYPSWESLGRYKGFIKSGASSIRDIVEIEYTTMSYYAYAALPAWKG